MICLMKKLIAIILLLAILLPVIALANTEDELVGTWIGMGSSFGGKMSLFIVRFFDDHTAIYEARGYDIFDYDGTDFVYDATWELKEDGVHVYYQNRWNSEQIDDFHLELTQAHYLAYKLVSTYILFEKMPEPRSISQIHTVENWD